MNGGFVGSWCQTLSDSRLNILYLYEAHAMHEQTNTNKSS